LMHGTGSAANATARLIAGNAIAESL